MATTIEVSGGAIRLLREGRGRIATLETYPVPADGDPLAALAAAPLPKPLGRVTVLMHHPDLLLRTMLQPPAPPERLARIIRFELAGMAREDGDPVAISWHVVQAMGGGDMRVLALLAKRRLLDDLRKALAGHGGRLDRLVHPAIGLYHAFRRQVPDSKGDVALVDVGGKHLHIAFVHDGELLFLRTQQPGMDELARQVGELRGIPQAEAARLIAKLGRGAPADLLDLIKRQGQSVAGTLTNNARFAKAQLHLDSFEPAMIYLSGSGAQVPGFAEALAERSARPVRLLNPFAGVLSELPGEELDRHAALPSPWTPTIGAGFAERLELDAVTEDRDRRTAFWRGEGAVRVACALALALLALAAIRQGFASASAGETVRMLKGTEQEPGLVPKAEAAHADLEKVQRERALAAEKLAFLDGERRPGRVALELLSAIAELQDPATCPVVLREYRVKHADGVTRVELEGFAESAARRGTADVQRVFEHDLAKRYQAIAALSVRPRPPGGDRQQFHYLIAIPDQQPTVATSAYAAKHGKGLKVDVAASTALDPEGVARVAADRLRKDEDEVTVVVTTAGAAQSFLWTAKDGLVKSR